MHRTPHHLETNSALQTNCKCDIGVWVSGFKFRVIPGKKLGSSGKLPRPGNWDAFKVLKRIYKGFPKTRGTLLGSHGRDCSILGSMLGSACFEKLPCTVYAWGLGCSGELNGQENGQLYANWDYTGLVWHLADAAHAPRKPIPRLPPAV